jgi:hypothetical protein
MPNGKQTRKPRAGRKTGANEIPPCAEWFWREIVPIFRRPPFRSSRSARHLRNAGIETLEAARDLLDEMIEWLKERDKPAPEMRRIRVEE